MNIRFYVDRSDYSIVVDGRITGEERVRIPGNASKDDRRQLPHAKAVGLASLSRLAI